MHARHVAGCVLLALQVGAIVVARFVPSRYFCWAPNDSSSEYRIEAVVDGRALDDAEIERRYHIGAAGVESRSMQLVLDVVRGYEETRGRQAPARVVIRYRVNGGEPRTWSWPAS
ncbi:hypothetical protein [Polyangium sp. 6x1]|uniref:hypothetical protein n=1 Tax=Polyangium sp. 6x1 TaxID=3042689 RepID=UPI0024824742|nr:hypothetical protein [Polyangium sp. 6x1]MDI1449842.1 hypothetical protein [Polyangium sp. 6x1]